MELQTLLVMNSLMTLPLFDSIEFIKAQKPPSHLKHLAKKDFFITKKFLESYSGRTGTFNSYRRETERLLHWCNYILNQPKLVSTTGDL